MHQKPCIETKKVIDRRKGNKTLSEVKPVENISKNPQSFLDISPVKRKSFLHINCKIMHMNNRILFDYEKVFWKIVLTFSQKVHIGKIRNFWNELKKIFFFLFPNICIFYFYFFLNMKPCLYILSLVDKSMM